MIESSRSWHVMPEQDVLASLDTSSDGLDQEDAERRLEQYGPNEIGGDAGVSAWRILLEQVKNILILILLAATVVSAFLGHALESIAILTIVLLAIALGFIQEYRAHNAIHALRRMAVPSAKVLRNGEEMEIPAPEVVPGDIIRLVTGDRIPADCRLLEAVILQLDEASLTGESLPVDKQTGTLSNPECVVADRTNMVYSGTDVTHGRGRAVVVATGMETELGKVSRLLQDVVMEHTPLQKNLEGVGRTLGVAAGIIVMVIVALGLIRGEPLLDMFIFGIALAVAVVPEALPAVVTISLSIGMQRMVKRNALVNRLPAVETLGSTSVICTDKTGTLTRDEMTVRSIWHGGENIHVSGRGYEPTGSFSIQDKTIEPKEGLQKMLVCGSLASDSKLVEEEGWSIHGDPTEGALVVAAAKSGLDKVTLDERYPRIGEIPFTSERKRMLTLHQDGESTRVCAKGAPEVIVGMCDRIMTDEGEQELTAEQRQQVLDAAVSMARQALRVIGIAYCENTLLEDSEGKLVLLGLAGMIDPPRQEAAEAINTCQKAGIKPVMITGDHPVTAAAIAMELGITRSAEVMTGEELERTSDQELENRVSDIDVYARVSPEHKLRVVNAWKSRGHVVAMTGDGVNDAPALKRADIGIAMGITGTDVSREAADMTLIDDNFASIVSAVEEGRAIFANIKKFLMYLLSSNIGEIGLLTLAALAGMPLPLTAVQILYVNLATDGLPALALAVDPEEEDLMIQRPRNAREGIFSRTVTVLMLAGGIWSTIANLTLFTWALNSGRELEQAMTMTFASLVLIEFLKAYSFRSDHISVFKMIFENKWLNAAVVFQLFLLMVIIYLPVLHEPFGTYAMDRYDWLAVAVTASTIIPILEAVKFLIRKGVVDTGTRLQKTV